MVDDIISQFYRMEFSNKVNMYSHKLSRYV